MKYLLTILSLLACVTAQASTVIIAYTNWDNTVATNASVRITPQSSPMQDGNFITIGPVVTTNLVNGVVTNVMRKGVYKLQPVSTAVNPFVIHVPDDNSTYYASQLDVRGIIFFPGGIVDNFQAGTGISFTTNGNTLIISEVTNANTPFILRQNGNGTNTHLYSGTATNFIISEPRIYDLLGGPGYAVPDSGFLTVGADGVLFNSFNGGYLSNAVDLIASSGIQITTNGPRTFTLSATGSGAATNVIVRPGQAGAVSTNVAGSDYTVNAVAMNNGWSSNQYVTNSVRYFESTNREPYWETAEGLQNRRRVLRDTDGTTLFEIRSDNAPDTGVYGGDANTRHFWSFQMKGPDEGNTDPRFTIHFGEDYGYHFTTNRIRYSVSGGPGAYTVFSNDVSGNAWYGERTKVVNVIGTNILLNIQPKTNATTFRGRTNNVASITIASPNYFSEGETVLISGVGGTGYNGLTEISIISGNRIDYLNTGSDENTTADTGGFVLSTNDVALRVFRNKNVSIAGDTTNTTGSLFLDNSYGLFFKQFVGGSYFPGFVLDADDNFVIGDVNMSAALFDVPTVQFSLYAPSILLRLDSNKNVAAVTVGSGLSFDGTTLSATGGGSATNAVSIVSTNGTAVSTAATNIDFWAGANTTIFATNRDGHVDITIGSTGGGSATNLTPWTSDIDGALYRLTNVANIQTTNLNVYNGATQNPTNVFTVSTPALSNAFGIKTNAEVWVNYRLNWAGGSGQLLESGHIQSESAGNSGLNNFLAGSTDNALYGSANAVVGGSGNLITNSTTSSGIFAGAGNRIGNTTPGSISSSVILGGSFNIIDTNTAYAHGNSAIIGNSNYISVNNSILIGNGLTNNVGLTGMDSAIMLGWWTNRVLIQSNGAVTIVGSQTNIDLIGTGVRYVQADANGKLSAINATNDIVGGGSNFWGTNANGSISNLNISHPVIISSNLIVKGITYHTNKVELYDAAGDLKIALNSDGTAAFNSSATINFDAVGGASFASGVHQLSGDGSVALASGVFTIDTSSNQTNSPATYGAAQTNSGTIQAAGFVSTGTGPGYVSLLDNTETNYWKVTANANMSTNVVWIGPTNPATGLIYGTNELTGNATNVQLMSIANGNNGDVLLMTAGKPAWGLNGASITNVNATNVTINPAVLASSGNQTNYTVQLLPGPSGNMLTIYTANTNVFITFAGTNQANWQRSVHLIGWTNTVDSVISYVSGVRTNFNYDARLTNGFSKVLNFYNTDTTGTNVLVSDAGRYR